MWSAKMIKNDSGSDEHSKFLSDDEQEARTVQHEQERYLWSGSAVQYAAMGTIIVLLAIDIYCRIYFQNSGCPASIQSQSPLLAVNGTISELPSAREAMTYVKRNLTGLFQYSNGTLTRKKDADAEYFGEPSRELDLIWADLLDHPLPILLENEIPAYPHIRDKDRSWPEEKIHFEPEVYHVLHCLNAVRQSVNYVLYPEVKTDQSQLAPIRNMYPKITGDWYRLHIEHCMDRIRQDVLCHADVTPTTFYEIDDLPESIILSRHSNRVCRDWESVQKWTQEREAVGWEEVKKEKAQGLHPDLTEDVYPSALP